MLKRVFEHKQGLVDGFIKRYKIHQLAYFEQTTSIEEAILREKQIKKWNRQWKLKLIEKTNPNWDDLYNKLTGFPPEFTLERHRGRE